jgi:hypothetical protein
LPVSACPGVFLASGCGRDWGVDGAAGLVFRRCRGGVVCESAVARAARPRAGGKGRRGPGNRGNPGFGGVPGFPGTLQAYTSGRISVVFANCRAQRGAMGTFHGYSWRFCLHLPRSSVRRLLVLLCTFPGHSCDEFPLQCGSGLVPPGVCYSRSRDGGSDLGHSPSRGGGEVGNTEAARSEHVSAGSRGNRAGTAAYSARTHGRGAVRSVHGDCLVIVRVRGATEVRRLNGSYIPALTIRVYAL